jgi:hypothetical protein
MISSAIILGLLGIILIFMPKELILYFKMTPGLFNLLILQLAGALYFGFALLNWMGKDNIIGGIYSKPVALGNFAHFFVGAITLIKVAFTNSSSFLILAVAVIYLIFAILFGVVFFMPAAIKK